MSNKQMPVLTFLVGVCVGAIIALLYAPSSGEQLRDDIRRERSRALDELDRVSADLKESVAETRGQLSAYVDQAKSGEEPVEDA